MSQTKLKAAAAGLYSVIITLLHYWIWTGSEFSILSCTRPRHDRVKIPETQSDYFIKHYWEIDQQRPNSGTATLWSSFWLHFIFDFTVQLFTIHQLVPRWCTLVTSQRRSHLASDRSENTNRPVGLEHGSSMWLGTQRQNHLSASWTRSY